MYLNLYFSLILPILVVKGKNSTSWHLLFLRLNEGYYDDDFNWILRDLGNRLLPEANCLTFMTDKFYDYSLNNMVLDDFKTVPLFKIRVKDYEDLLSPNYKTVSVIKEARAKGCNTYIILIANGEQVARFLKFGDKHRVIDTRVKYLMLYDSRIFIKELNYIWKKIVNVLFIRKLPGSLRYELSTVPFPKPIRGKLTPMRLDSWRAGKFQKSKDLFVDKTSNLRNETLRAATFEHMPSTTKVPLLKNTAMSSGFLVQGTEESPLIYSGLEIQMVVSCSAYGCMNRQNPGVHLKFFGFPSKQMYWCGTWVSADKRKNFAPTKHSRPPTSLAVLPSITGGFPFAALEISLSGAKFPPCANEFEGGGYLPPAEFGSVK